MKKPLKFLLTFFYFALVASCVPNMFASYYDDPDNFFGFGAMSEVDYDSENGSKSVYISQETPEEKFAEELFSCNPKCKTKENFFALLDEIELEFKK